DFINCVIWQKPAETLANYASKGTLLGVTGRIQTRNYENQQRQRVYVTEVVVKDFQLLEKKSSESQSNYNAPEQYSNDFQANNHANKTPFEGSNLNISDDLPF
uniref:single-stranded DNA-binding protein n=1 Tax=uncultured Enterococcus sp. TaxID=167972 RepID=UPI00259A3C81